jgi:PAS domain S-box-containing protein
MADTHNNTSKSLHKKAKELFREKSSDYTEDRVRSPEDTEKLLHELHVHQIELKLQNEELRRAHEQLEAARLRYFELYDLAPVGYITLSENGLILEANLTAATLLGAVRGALVKQPVTRFILKEDQDIYYLYRKNLFDSGQRQACELRMVKTDGSLFRARLDATAANPPRLGSGTALSEVGENVCRVVLTFAKAFEETVFQ